jgi:hypothetical protein
MKHTVKNLRFAEEPVEAVTEFRKVTGQVIWADTMMYITNVAFDNGDQGMNRGQDLRALFPRTGNEPLMSVVQSIQEAISLPTVGFATTASTRRALTRD